MDLDDGSSRKSMRRIRVGHVSMLPTLASRCSNIDTDMCGLCKYKESVVEKKHVKESKDVFLSF
jgi:hypothetical protein